MSKKQSTKTPLKKIEDVAKKLCKKDELKDVTKIFKEEFKYIAHYSNLVKKQDRPKVQDQTNFIKHLQSNVEKITEESKRLVEEEERSEVPYSILLSRVDNLLQEISEYQPLKPGHPRNYIIKDARCLLFLRLREEASLKVDTAARLTSKAYGFFGQVVAPDSIARDVRRYKKAGPPKAERGYFFRALLPLIAPLYK